MTASQPYVTVNFQHLPPNTFHSWLHQNLDISCLTLWFLSDFITVLVTHHFSCLCWERWNCTIAKHVLQQLVQLHHLRWQHGYSSVQEVYLLQQSPDNVDIYVNNTIKHLGEYLNHTEMIAQMLSVILTVGSQGNLKNLKYDPIAKQNIPCNKRAGEQHDKINASWAPYLLPREEWAIYISYSIKRKTMGTLNKGIMECLHCEPMK